MSNTKVYNVFTSNVQRAAWQRDPNEQLIIDRIQGKGEVINTEGRVAISFLLAGTARPLIYASDNTFIRREEDVLRAAAVEYIRTGGTIITGPAFNNGIAGSDPFRTIGDNGWFEALGLPWDNNDHQECDRFLNTNFSHFDTSGLPKYYEEKDVEFLEEVAARDMLAGCYSIADGWFATAVAYTKVGQGYYGYIGDKAATEDTAQLVLAMLGLL